jgi:hypothetical protein
MLHRLECDEEEAPTQRTPEPVAKTLRGLNPRITILNMPAEEPLEGSRPGFDLEWDDEECVTRECTPFYDGSFSQDPRDASEDKPREA